MWKTCMSARMHVMQFDCIPFYLILSNALTFIPNPRSSNTFSILNILHVTCVPIASV